MTNLSFIPLSSDKFSNLTGPRLSEAEMQKSLMHFLIVHHMKLDPTPPASALREKSDPPAIDSQVG